MGLVVVLQAHNRSEHVRLSPKYQQSEPIVQDPATAQQETVGEPMLHVGASPVDGYVRVVITMLRQLLPHFRLRAGHYLPQTSSVGDQGLGVLL